MMTSNHDGQLVDEAQMMNDEEQVLMMGRKVGTRKLMAR